MKRFMLISLVALTVRTNAETQIPAPTVPLFEIQVTAQSTNPVLPWQRRPPVNRSGFGILIDSDHVLTTEGLVRHSRFVELRREHSDRRIAAIPVKADPELNLALLRILDPSVIEALEPLQMADQLPQNERFNIVQLDDTREFQSGEAQLVRITVDDLPNSQFRSIMLRLLIDLDIQAVGAPALDAEGQVAGMVVRYDNSSRTAMALPASVLRRFLDDVADGDYKGAAHAGFLWRPLTDPVKRNWLGADDIEGGVHILFSGPDHEEGGLQAMDILLELDGYPIDAMGYYIDPDYGRLLMPHLIRGRRAPGETVSATVLRDGKQQEISFVLQRFQDEAAYIPESYDEDERDYIVEGGLVLYELTGAWLRAHGRNWGRRIDSRLVNLYQTSRLQPEQPGDRVVVLAAVLSHDINIGYQHLRNERVTAVNGTPIRNLNDVFDILDRDGHITRVTLHGIGIDLVLDENTIAAANRDLQRQYNIPVLRHRVSDP